MKEREKDMNDDVRIIILRIVVGVVNHLFTTTTYQSPFFPPALFSGIVFVKSSLLKSQ